MVNSNTAKSPTSFSDTSDQLSPQNKSEYGNRMSLGVNIEEVFSSVSTETTTGLSVCQADIVLTPRSAEACLRLGVNPEVLKIRDLDTFYENGIDTVIQRMRHESYIQRRHELMRLCRKERGKLISMEENMLDAMSRPGSRAAHLSTEEIANEREMQSATLIQNERKRIEKLRLRQEKELQQMLEYEVRQANMAEELNRKMEEERRKSERRQLARERLLAQSTEQRRLRELKKQAETDAEEEERKLLSLQRYEEERRQEDCRRLAKTNSERDLKEREIERIRKAEEHRLVVLSSNETQQRQIREKVEQLELVHEKRQRKLEEKQLEVRRSMAAKAITVAQRMQKNAELVKEIEIRRKEDFQEKQIRHEEMHEKHMMDVAEERELVAQQRDLLDQRRQALIAMKSESEEKEKLDILEKFERQDEAVAEIRMLQERQHEISTEKKHLQMYMKSENVQRVKRSLEYKRIETVKKIADADERCDVLLRQKLDLVKKRRKMAIDTKTTKDGLLRLMEDAKSNKSMANKLLKLVQSGKGMSDVLNSSGSLNNIAVSPLSASHNKNERSLSASRIAHDASIALGPKPTIAGGTRFVKSARDDAEEEEEDGNVFPYISPYDAEFGSN